MKSITIKHTKSLALGFWVMVSLVCVMVYSYHGSAMVIIDKTDPAMSPDTIYAAHCVSCHGSDGKAKTSKGKRSGATDFTSNWNTDEARGIRIITNGKGEMPSFKGKLSSQEIREVFSHVIKFKQ